MRLDVLVEQDGRAVTDLTQADFEVLEDNVPQPLSSFELIRPVSDAAAPGGAAPAPARDARRFVLFLDTLHARRQERAPTPTPVGDLLDRVVGERDLVGVMTPEMSARNMTFSPRTAPIPAMMGASWAWGDRPDPHEADLHACYPDRGDTAGLADALIARRRERQTLEALNDLSDEIESLDGERTYVFLLSDGWTLPSPDEHLARALTPPRRAAEGARGAKAPASDPPPDDAAGPSLWCERERSLVALADLSMEFRLMLQRANRALISFYPVEPRSLSLSDAPAPERPAPDVRGDARRRGALRDLAADTVGAVISSEAAGAAEARLSGDVGPYYLLGYAPTNAKPDGRYRRLTVRVRRPGATVRTRAGYLAASARQAGPPSSPSALGTSSSTRPGPSTSAGGALSRLPVSRRPPPIYLQAGGGRGDIAVVVELDRATAAQPEWSKGGEMVVEVEPADGTGRRGASVKATLEPGQRIHAFTLPEGETLRPGRYQVRVSAGTSSGRAGITAGTIVDVPGPAALLGSAPTASRRGPGTGRTYEPTADPRFRRTERLSLTVAKLAADATVTGRLLNAAEQPMRVPVAVTDRVDEASRSRVVVADVAFAPLAAGDYVLELTATSGSLTETLVYAVRIVN
ncbi:MAG: VWA domain-containing protein [Vicinamibacterales bacterium]